jgi:hypothetical protein
MKGSESGSVQIIMDSDPGGSKTWGWIRVRNTALKTPFARIFVVFRIRILVLKLIQIQTLASTIYEEKQINFRYEKYQKVLKILSKAFCMVPELDKRDPGLKRRWTLDS